MSAAVASGGPSVSEYTRVRDKIEASRKTTFRCETPYTQAPKGFSRATCPACGLTSCACGVPARPFRKITHRSGVVAGSRSPKMLPIRARIRVVPSNTVSRANRPDCNLARTVSGSGPRRIDRSEEHTSELQSRRDLVCRLLLEKKKQKRIVKDDEAKREINTISL